MRAIVPINDLKSHRIYSCVCHCDPHLEICVDGDVLIIHSSFDGREGLEMALEILNKK